MHTAIKSWVGALHADSQWLADLRPSTDGEGRPVVCFAPALILRKRTQVGMVRIYDSLIERLQSGTDEVPAGWRGLVDDEDDVETSMPPGDTTGKPTTGVEETFFPLPANRDQRRIVDALSQRRGVLV